MPKETIVLHRDVFGPDSAATSLMEVRWGKNEFVEIGLRIVHAADHHSDYIPNESEGSAEHPAGVPIRGSYSSMERGQINDLIRHLRRARDQAYGRDE